MFGPKRTIHIFICKIYIWNFNLEMFGTLGPGEMNHEKQFPNPKLVSWTWNLNERGVLKWITQFIFSWRLAFWSEPFFVIPRYKMITNYNQFSCKFTFKSTDLFLEPPNPECIGEISAFIGGARGRRSAQSFRADSSTAGFSARCANSKAALWLVGM